MDPITQQQALAAAGAAAGAEGLYVDEVFSTFLYEGNEGSQTINNGIDLSGEGGLVWVKRRNLAERHSLFDTENGITKHLATNENSEARTRSFVSSFNADGFSFNTGDTEVNNLNDTYASWTFRKAPGFFDVVTYTGNGSASGQTISHNLGSAPGSIWIKRVNVAEDWCVYHRSVGTAGHLRLNTSTNYTTNQKFDNVTSTSFDIFDDDLMINGSGDTYVAYIFAHDDQSFGDDGDEAIIKCGSYTGTGSLQTIDIGFEPQWLLIKNRDSNYNWLVFDTMRGWDTTHADAFVVNSNDPESDVGAFSALGIKLSPTARGFTISQNYAFTNQGSENYIYIAIRRPHKPPETATDVFNVVARSGTSASITTSPGNNRVTDMVITKARNAGNNHVISSRIAGQTVLGTDSDSDDNNTFWTDKIFWDKMSGVGYANYDQVNASGRNYLDLFFTRAAKFFDVVHFGAPSGGSQTISHSLTVVPEMIWVKNRDSSYDWQVYHKALGTQSWLYLNRDLPESTSNSPGFANVGATTFDVGNYVAVAGSRNIAYLFATLPGISKVGSYTGTGSDLNIDCGFTNGARFVMIKKYNSGTTDWWYVDTARGINSGNDPGLLMNSSGSESSSYDLVDPYTAGFTAAAGTASINTQGNEYIFLAIA